MSERSSDGGTVNTICVVLVSSPFDACGIATYTTNLARALREQGADVHVTTARNLLDNRIVYPDSRPYILHVQHEFGIYEDETPLFNSVCGLSSAGIRTVVTMHTEDRDACERFSARFDSVILHHDLFDLRSALPSLVQIPHGIPDWEDGVQNSYIYRERFNMPHESFCIGTTGFLWNHRPIETVIKGLTKFAAQQKDVFLHLVTSSHSCDTGNEVAHKKRGNILSLAEEHGFRERIWVGDSFIDGPEYQQRISTLDLGFSFASVDWNSSSGSITEMLGLGIPVVANDVIHFRGVRDACHMVKDIDEIAPAIINLYHSWKQVGSRMKERVSAMKSRLSYRHIAQAHLAVYKRLLDDTCVVHSMH